MYIEWDEVVAQILFVLAAIFFVGLVIFVAVWYPRQANYPVEPNHIITVDRKEYADDKYLVFTDNEVFCVEDSLLHHRWDSSDMYNAIEEGQTYIVTVAGHRRPFWSMYRNILEMRIPDAVK